MINALPFFFGPLVSPTPGNGQTGGVGLDQAKTPGNPSENPFAKILRDQSVAFSSPESLPLIIQSEDQKPLPDLESPPGNPNLSLQVLVGPDLPVDLFRQSSADTAARPLAFEGQPNLYPVTLLESAGQRLTESEDVMPLSVMSLTALWGNAGNAIGEEEILQEQMRLSSGDVLQEGPLTPAVVSPQVFLAGGPGSAEVYTPATSNQPGLPLFKGYSLIQSPLVGSSLTDKSAPPIDTNANRQPILQDAVKEHAQLRESVHEEPETESAVELVKNVGKPLDRLSGNVQETDMLLQRMPSSTARTPQEAFRPLVNQAFQAPLPFKETPAGLADVVQSSQNRLKSVNGVSSISGDVSGQGKELSMAIPSDVLGDAILSTTGDRSKDVVETTGKIVGVDPHGGQGVNTGMGGSTNSQPGFQQSSSSHSLGISVRMAEERVPELPTPALQRLQMDVQLSETNRIQIDVGVQQRQVYAGLLMDQGTLKNLAVQCVPQLENQLAQVDMDLQEFSAEVRDQHGKQESETPSSWLPTQHGQRGFTTFSHAPGSLPNTVKRVEEQGLHLVA